MNTRSTAAIPASWTSLAEMKAAHRQLLEDPSRGARGMGHLEPVRNFIQNGSELGTRLASLDDRVEAQRMLDYWGSVVNTGGSQNESNLVRAVLADYQDSGEKDAGQKADELYQDASYSGRTLLKRLFLGLIALEENGSSFRLLPRTAQELTGKLTAPPREIQPREWLEKLVSTGVVEQGPDGSYRLVGPSVMEHWKIAGNWMAQRRRLRGAARFWAEHDRDPTAFLEPGDLLDEADGYLDLSELESEFVAGSKIVGAARKVLKWRFVGIVAALGVLALSAALVITDMGRREATKNFNRAKDEFAKAKTQRDNAKTESDNAKVDRDAAKKERDIAKKELAEAKQKFDEALQNREIASKETTQAKADQQDAVQAKDNELAKLNQRRDELTGELDNAFRIPSLTPDLRKKIEEFRDKLIADSQAPQASQPFRDSPESPPPVFQPGSGIMVRAQEETLSIGTTGVFLRKSGDQRDYLLMPSILLSATQPNDIYPVRSLVDQASNPRLFTTSANPSYGMAIPMGLAAIPIEAPSPLLKINNVTANGRTIRGIASPAGLSPGSTVTWIGLSSGVKESTIQSYDAVSELIRMNGTSVLRDAGAPVLNKDNQLLGILLGTDPNDENLSIVKAAQTFLLQRNLSLAGDDAAPSKLTPWDGVMGEILVAGEPAGFEEKAKKYVDLLLKEGITMPVPAAQPRKRVPSKTEIRYFREEDADLARRFAKLLIEKGKVKDTQLRVSLVEDPTAPPKFIQISFAKELLAPPQPNPLR